MAHPTLPDAQRAILHEGVAIPAHPLALDRSRRLDERRQRALTRYYIAAGAGGVAVGVHTTQFAIREPGVGLFEPVLALAIEEIRARRDGGPRVAIAGICGETDQAVREAACARELGYDAGLLSLGGLASWPEAQLLERARAVAECIPVFGFYLQPAAGGRDVGYGFWREFCEIPNVVAIKIAPFSRYRTVDVVRAVCDSSRRDEIALYTGNDDAIVADLLAPYRFVSDGEPVEKRIVGGLLGQWAVWTRSAVTLVEEAKRVRKEASVPDRLLGTAGMWTDANAAIFDAANGFRGCIPGIHEILVRAGLLEGRWCLDPGEDLSPGQLEEIDRVCRCYPELSDQRFIEEHRDGWLK